MSSSFDWSKFGGQSINSKNSDEETAKKSFDWNEFGGQSLQEEKKEGTEPGRYIGSAITGAAGLTRYGITTGALSLMGMGESLAEMDELADRIPELMEKFPQAPWKEGYNKETFKQEYAKGLEDASKTFPTVSKIWFMKF